MFTSPERSALMKRVGRKNTFPELAVRRFLHAAGLRFRVQVRELPGTPDIVLPRYRTVVFVDGCFWHGHACRHGSVRAKSNVEFWDQKITENRERDERKTVALKRLDWRVERVWECECADAKVLKALCRRIFRRAAEMHMSGRRD